MKEVRYTVMCNALGRWHVQRVADGVKVAQDLDVYVACTLCTRLNGSTLDESILLGSNTVKLAHNVHGNAL